VEGTLVKQLDADFFVGPQLVPEHMPLIAEKGVKVVINNRPDGEQSGQPSAETMRQAAEAAGLAFYSLPVTGPTLNADTIKQTKKILDKGQGPVLAYCASGMRCSLVWALVQICEEGAASEEVYAHIEAQGYDLTNARPLLDQIAAGY
jgi:uncharacterized protein (TIGR01244 family)